MIEIMEKENWGGLRKRFLWLAKNILLLEDGDCALDVGCGSGLYVTIPINLEIKNRNRDIRLEGVDIANESIDYSKKNAEDVNLDKNLFYRNSIYEIDKKYKAVICSEVLEHIGDEEIDKFCTQLCLLCAKGGMLLITVPNGRGSYEKGVILWQQFQKMLDSRMMKKLRKVYRKFRKVKEEVLPMTVSDSPHVQFFDYETIVKLFESRGMKMVEFSGSNIFYNNFFDAFIPRINLLMRLNNKLGDIWPIKASDYYFKFIKE